MASKIAEAFVKAGLIDQDKLDECIQIEQETGESLEKILISKGYLSEEQALEEYSKELKIPFYEDLSGTAVPPEFIENVSMRFARTYCLIGVARENGTFMVATCSPMDFHPMDDVAAMLHSEVEPILATRKQITSLIDKAYQERTGADVDHTIEEMDESGVPGSENQLEGSEDLLDVAHKAPIIKLVNMILFEAVRRRASDIHIQPYPDRLQVRYRIDGILYDTQRLPKEVQDAVVSRIKVMGRMDIAERRMPQDGRTGVKISDKEIDLRISSVPTAHGERIVLRILDKTARLFIMEEIGMSEEILQRMNELIYYSHGIMFVTGPTGSGKTTTLYSALSKINSSEKNILTVEDPIEYQLAGVSQMQVADKKGITFATALRHVVRQDPDIIMVGEVRDLETASLAIEAALTGHLVFSTLHTNDAAGAVTRLLDIGVEPYLASSSVIAVMAQRLARLICSDCKEAYEPSNETLIQLGLDRDRLQDGKLFRGIGCEECMNTGYRDRTGMYELLVIDEEVQVQITEHANASAIKKRAVEKGLITLRMDGINKAVKGQTTIEEVMRITQRDSF